MKNRPHIIYIHSHDTGRFIQPCGYGVDTPNLQKLAEEGILFRKAFTAAPTCSPSRAGLLTGQAPHASGMLGLAHLGWRLNDYRQHLIHTLHDTGYVSALCGIQHIAARPAATAEEIGYDEILAVNSNESADIGAAAAAYLQRDHDQPFFLSVGFWDTHRPFPEAEGNSNHVQVAPTLPDTPETRADMAAFQTSVQKLDAGIGRVLDALEKSGHAQNTLVICTTDHGLPMPKMKGRLTDHGLGVFLIMRGPGVFSGGRVCDAMVSNIDVFPTLCEWLGIAKPAWLQGRSMMPLLRGNAEEINDAVFAEVTWHAAYEPQRAVRTARWKYIRRFDRAFGQVVLPNCDESAAKKLLVEQAEWGAVRPSSEQLYDLLLDPQEAQNLTESAAHAEQLETLRGRLNDWMQRTNDPLCSGAVELPPCGAAWPQDAPGPIDEPVVVRKPD